MIALSPTSSIGTAQSQDFRLIGTVVLRYRIFLEQKRYAPTTINLRLAAVRRVAFEAADSGLLSPELAAGIRRMHKGMRCLRVYQRESLREKLWLPGPESKQRPTG